LAQGEVSIEMEKVLRNMPNTDANQDIRAKKILQINREHKIFEKIKSLYESNQDALKEISRVLLDEAKLIEGLPIDDMSRFVELVTKYVSEG
jgi:molecular chaperone HtpG